MKDGIIYLDNAATSWPKPREVGRAISYYLEHVGANPGRSGHRLSIEAGRILYQARENVAELFNVKNPLRIVFGINATEALNLALRGLLRPGDHVICSSLEHNSVMRPLRDLEVKGVDVTVVWCSAQGFLDLKDIENSIKKNTVMVVLNHASNVVGSLLPISDVGKMARKHGLLFLVDAAQTGGCYPINIEEEQIDLLAFTGHKSLLGPQGTGGLIIGECVDTKRLIPLKSGGTGSKSEYEIQPEFLPDLYESGTPNSLGLAGLSASVQFVLKQGIDRIRGHEMRLTQHLIEGLQKIPEVVLYGTCDLESRTAVVSFNIKNVSPSDVGLRLDEEYSIMCRVGLHCAPAAHKTTGTFPQGTVRFSIGYFNTHDEIEQAVMAVENIAKNARS